MNRIHGALFFIGLCVSVGSCKKIVNIGPPTNTITTSQVFADSADAVSALLGVYAKIINTGTNANVADGNVTLITGMSSDELIDFGSIYGPNGDAFTFNDLNVSNDYPNDFFWTPAYQLIYQTNAIVEGVNSSSGNMSVALKGQILGEAKVLRALLYFYLTNLFDNVPYVTSTNFNTTASSASTSQATIYQEMIADLISAQGELAQDYSLWGNERVRVNKWAATALLARMYLYTGDYADAILQADSVIGNASLFQLPDSLNSVFLANSAEAILQWKLNTAVAPYNIVPEAFNLMPYCQTCNPKFYLNTQLVNAFEPGDNRWGDWVDSTIYSGQVYYYPNKYKIGVAEVNPNGTATEYYMVMRLAEQYLIRAEANARLGNLTPATADLNRIRERAGLTDLSSNLIQSQVLNAVAQERRIELFAEWGHRWLDLKRTGAVDSVMTVATPLKGGNTSWNSYQQWYPIPAAEIQKDHNLTQNTGY